MAKGKNQWVSPNGDGRWKVQGQGNSKSTAIYDTKQDVVGRGREIAKNQSSELFVKRRDGTIQKRNSYGNDPHPPKG
ncbi:MAG: DUF2188 domain-containing protein [Chloroflexi bacterium]|nr:DUF2188 domain-containing protein [Chloroflexota bacterium]MYC55834.1 DUF2188 domain-containing protein [Chloroflexota bacterium]